jgi:hypothetical protein
MPIPPSPPSSKHTSLYSKLVVTVTKELIRTGCLNPPVLATKVYDVVEAIMQEGEKRKEKECQKPSIINQFIKNDSCSERLGQLTIEMIENHPNFKKDKDVCVKIAAELSGSCRTCAKGWIADNKDKLKLQ